MDLDKILRDSFDDGSLENVDLQTLITLSPDKEKIKDCMKEAIRQALESLHKKLDKEVSKAWDDWDEGYQYGIEFSKREIMSIMDEL